MASTSGTVAVSRRADDVADEETPTPVDIIARWPYYASKLYQEETARRACGDKVELVTLNPSLLLGPGDDRLSSTRPILQFLAREIPLMPAGGLNVVDARDVAALMPVAMARGNAGRALPGGRGQLDLRRVLRPAGTPDQDPGAQGEDRGRLPVSGRARAGRRCTEARAQGPRRARERGDGPVLLVPRRGQGGARARLRRRAIPPTPCATP